MSVDHLAPRRSRSPRAAIGILLPLAFAAGGAALSVQAFVQAARRAESRLQGDFRFDAYQRSELVRRVLGESLREFESLGNFYAGSEEATPEELGTFARRPLESGTFVGFAWLGPSAAGEFREGAAPLARGGGYSLPAAALGELGGAAAAAAREAIGLADAAGIGRAVAVPYLRLDGSCSVALASSLPAPAGPGPALGRGGVLLGLVSLEGLIERAIGSSPPVGLPTSIYELAGESERRLLMFHEPRLDALLGRPIHAPDPRARQAYTQEIGYLGRRWAIRVEASPAYLERRREGSPLALLVLGLAASAAGSLYVRSLFVGRGAARTEAALRSAELERYFALGRDLFCIADARGRIRRANEEWLRCLGYRPEALLGRPLLSLVRGEDRAATKEAMRRLARGGSIDGFLHRLDTAEGGFRWLEWRAASDRATGLAYAAARDVSERVRTEALLTASVREKEALLREIHHRVKNNMQIVSSLVSLEARMAGCGGAMGGAGSDRRILGLVRAMSLVHEALYASPELDSVRMAPYLRDLVLSEASASPARGLAIDVRVGELRLDLERATLVGLVADELAAGLIRRYAEIGPELAQGHELRVGGGESPGGGCWFEVRDEGFDAAEPDLADGSLAQALLDAIVAQMGGELQVTGSGARISLPA